MAGSRHTPRRTLAVLALILTLLLLPAGVTAGDEIIFNEVYTIDNSDVFEVNPVGGSSAGAASMSSLVISPALAETMPSYIIHQGQKERDIDKNWYNAAPDSASWSVTFTSTGGGVIGSGTFGFFKYNVGGPLGTNWLQTYLEIDDLDYTQITSSRGVVFSSAPDGLSYPKYVTHTGLVDTVGGEDFTTDRAGYWVAFMQYISGNNFYTRQMAGNSYYPYIDISWENEITVTNLDTALPSTHVLIDRTHPNATLGRSSVYLNTTTAYYSDLLGTESIEYWVLKDHYPISINVLEPGTNTWFNRTISLDVLDPDNPIAPGAPVTVYVRNSQTGAAIANSRCVIDALVDGDYLPVINRTEPSGIFSVTLQPTGGGLPNPDGYRLIASADGYINPLPEINFTVDQYTTSIYCYLDPIAGGPLDENKTFIDFFVRDMSANPISGATVNFGGYTLLTNSQGYTVFEVNKNATYTYTVSKSGYGSLTGNVVIGDDPRHTINTVLAPAVTPTTPTPIPTSTPIGPTPTLTGPTGEPASNLLEWFAAHFGMILGGGVEIGKIFMWLCFTVPVGVYVGKEAKAGAAGFMAGAGIVTLFFVLIGWVPIWLVVLIVLIIGLLYAKVFNTPDNGGGR